MAGNGTGPSRAGPRRVILALAVLAAGVVIAPPAEAKVPSRTPETTVKCKNGKKAKIWWQGTKQVEVVNSDGDTTTSWDLSQFAVDNRCTQWLYFDIRHSAESESDCCHGVQVAPGANFTKTAKDQPPADLVGGYGTKPFSVRETEKECWDPNGDHNQIRWDAAKNGKVTRVETCPRRYPESDSRIIVCPESWNPTYNRYDERAEGVWKLDDKKIIKLAARNYCEGEMLYWWKTSDGRRISLWVDEANPYSSATMNIFDLWKDELDPLPRKTKDGVIHFIEAPPGRTTEDTAAYDENWRVYQGKPYKWVS
jgi:hypothetical protein